MARIIIFQHSRLGTPGRIGMTLRDHGFRLDIRRLDLAPEQGGKPVPPDLDDVQGVISLGGPQNVGENHAWIKPEQAFLRAAHEASIPVIGICLGAQLLADALGGKVAQMDKPECGFHPVDILVPGQTEPMLAGLPWRHAQFHTHEQQITDLPPGAQLLMSSALCKVQAFKIGMRSFGIQFHPECDRSSIETVHAEGTLFSQAGVSIDELHRQLDAYYEQFARLGDRLALNIATLCFPFSGLLAG